MTPEQTEEVENKAQVRTQTFYQNIEYLPTFLNQFFNSYIKNKIKRFTFYSTVDLNRTILVSSVLVALYTNRFIHNSNFNMDNRIMKTSELK